MSKHDRMPPNDMQWQDHNEVIQLLSELYPKCFFVNPKQRQPLKLNIVNDLEREKEKEPALAWYNIGAAVDWYTKHISYDYSCTVGTKRINLDGKAVGTITESEAREAQERIAIKGKVIAARRGTDALSVTHALHGKGGMTDDQLRKIPAPERRTADDNGVVDNILGQSLDDAIAALTKARELLTIDNSALRIALLRGAIGVATTSIQDLLKQTEDDAP